MMQGLPPIYQLDVIPWALVYATGATSSRRRLYHSLILFILLQGSLTRRVYLFGVWLFAT
jgi:hypothetical protein